MRKSLLPQRNAPGDLAAELAAARATFEARRANIIERGTTRIEQIRSLRQELEIEENALVGVVNEA